MTTHAGPRRRVLLGLLPALLAAAGCLSRPPLATRTFSIDPPAPAAGAPAPGGVTVSLSRVDVAAQYSGMSLVYRTGMHELEPDPYASFAATPGAMLTSAIRGYVLGSGFVAGVVAPGDAVAVRARIEPSVSELFGDFQNSAEPIAVLTLKFRVLAPAAGAAPASEILMKVYTQRVRLPRRTAAAVAEGWNTGLAEIMKEFLADLKSALAARP